MAAPHGARLWISASATVAVFTLFSLLGVRPFWLAYNVPIAWPFAAFVVDWFYTHSRYAKGIDACVVVLALLRANGAIPGYSGHVLFLTYATLCGESRFTKVSAALVLVSVLYMKLYGFHDFVTPVGGFFLAVIAAGVRVQYRDKAST